MSADQPVTLTDQEREQLAAAINLAGLATTSKAAVSWGMPLVDILATEGHTEDCDAVTGENLTLCDCWWVKVRAAAGAMSEVATLADAELDRSQSAALDDVVESIAAAAFERGRQAGLGEAERIAMGPSGDVLHDAGTARDIAVRIKRAAVLPPVPVDAHTSSEQEDDR